MITFSTVRGKNDRRCLLDVMLKVAYNIPCHQALRSLIDCVSPGSRGNTDSYQFSTSRFHRDGQESCFGFKIGDVQNVVLYDNLSMFSNNDIRKSSLVGASMVIWISS